MSNERRLYCIEMEGDKQLHEQLWIWAFSLPTGGFSGKNGKRQAGTARSIVVVYCTVSTQQGVARRLLPRDKKLLPLGILGNTCDNLAQNYKCCR